MFVRLNQQIFPLLPGCSRMTAGCSYGKRETVKGNLVRADDGEDVREKKKNKGSTTSWSFTGTAGV